MDGKENPERSPGVVSELFRQTASRDELRKLYAVELFVDLGAIIAAFYAMDAGVLSLREGMVVLAVVFVGVHLFEAYYE